MALSPASRPSFNRPLDSNKRSLFKNAYLPSNKIIAQKECFEVVEEAAINEGLYDAQKFAAQLL